MRVDFASPGFLELRVKKRVGAMVISSRPCDDGRGPICSRASWGAGLSVALWSLVLDGESKVPLPSILDTIQSIAQYDPENPFKK